MVDKMRIVLYFNIKKKKKIDVKSKTSTHNIENSAK